MPVVTMDAAQASGAPQLWPEAPGNIALDWAGTHPDPDANARRGRAHHRLRQACRARQASTQPAAHPRHHGAARRDRALRRGERQLSSARLLAERGRACATTPAAVMNIPKEKLRVITEDVGGAFGMKTGAYPEYIAQLVGAKIDQAAGALDGEPLGVVPQRRACARHRDRSRACARRERASSWRCACGTSPTWAPMSARSAPTCRRSTSRAAFPACTTSARSTSA